MGMSAYGIVAYGYDLGGDESRWRVREAGEYGELPDLDWYDPEGDDDGDFESAAHRHLRAEIAGFTEQWMPGSDGYFDRVRAADARVAVRVESYGHHDFPQFLLVTTVIRVHWGETKELDFAALAAEPDAHGWDVTLSTALRALGLTPTQEQPRWLLCSSYG